MAHIEFIKDLFDKLGLLINEKKSTLTPTQKLAFIGVHLDATIARESLPRARFMTIRASPLTTAHTCMRLLGHMATCTCVVQHSRLHLQHLQEWLTSGTLDPCALGRAPYDSRSCSPFAKLVAPGRCGVLWSSVHQADPISTTSNGCIGCWMGSPSSKPRDPRYVCGHHANTGYT